MILANPDLGYVAKSVVVDVLGRTLLTSTKMNRWQPFRRGLWVIPYQVLILYQVAGCLLKSQTGSSRFETSAYRLSWYVRKWFECLKEFQSFYIRRKRLEKTHSITPFTNPRQKPSKCIGCSFFITGDCWFNEPVWKESSLYIGNSKGWWARLER